MAYTTVQDIEEEWNQEVDSGSVTHVLRLIDKAERLLLRLIPTIPARITSGALTQADVVDVVCSMVLRVLRNPQGYTSESAGDYSYQLSARSASGRIHLLPEERRLLGGAPRAYSIALVDEALEDPLKPLGLLGPREWVVPATGEAP